MTKTPSDPGRPLDELVPELYEEMRALAQRFMRDERAGHTLQPTALVHEAYLRLASVHGLETDDRPRMLGLAARIMRQILVDHARARHAAKRGASPLQVTLTEGAVVVEPSFDLLALDEALERMETVDARQVRIVELRFLAGLSVEETADLLEISTATVKRESAFAKAWLSRELTGSSRGG